MSDVDLRKLRDQFPAGVIGKLPRVTCPKCSKGQCDEGHRKIRCEECKSYISERHIHLDYVGHADVTIRLIDVDPEWTWEPQATDPDPEILKAAMASGNPEIVRMVIANAPPKFERDRNGNPVGLWINLTVGGSVKPGVGSCPANQNDAEKVLIGDALRNAAMRFGVAVDLWAKGDRADPSAENPTSSAGQAARHGRQGGQVSRPNQESPAEPPPADTEPDKDAQAFADEAHQIRALSDLEGVHKRARQAGKLTAFIRNPSSGGIGKLALYIDWRRQQLTDVDKALGELDDAAKAARMEIGDVEVHVKQTVGVSLEDATPAQIRQAAQALKDKAAA